MKVIACGPESSGTRMLTKVLTKYLGIEVIHRSMPHGDDWWDWHDFGSEAKFVVISRRPDITGLSAVANGHVPNIQAHRKEWKRAMTELGRIQDAYWVSYEAFVETPKVQADNIARWLGVTPASNDVITVFDANEKWIGVFA